MGDDECQKPDAALNFPPWAMQFVKSRRKKNDSDKCSGKRKERSAEDILNEADNDEVLSLDKKRRIAVLQASIRTIQNEGNDSEVRLESLY